MITALVGTTVMLFAAISSCEGAAAVKQVLTFGGSDMIGSVVLKNLFERGGYNITMVTRGTWGFNSSEEIRPNVYWTPCDREACMNIGDEQEQEDEAEIAARAERGENKKQCTNALLETCPELMDIVNKTSKFDYVLDFSGFQPRWIQDALEALGGEKKIGLYIYMSKQLMYEVSETTANDVKTLESDAVKPTDEKKRKELERENPEGDNIFDAELVLQDQRKGKPGGLWSSASGVPYVILRVADLFGPMDTTYKWPVYQLWMNHYHELEMPFQVPDKIEKKKFSLTYSEDAANAVLLAMDTPKAWDDTYNIALSEEFTLWGLLQEMAEVVGVKGGIERIKAERKKGGYHYFFPTVDSGPLDITKAQIVLGFKPTSATEAFDKTADWYHNVYLYDEDERMAEVMLFMMDFLPFKRKHEFYHYANEYLYENGIEFDLKSVLEDDSEDEEKEEL